MSWLARLKKIEISPEEEATKPTKTLSVVFVAPDLAFVEKTGVNLQAANDAAALPAVVSEPSPKADLPLIDSAVLATAYYAHHFGCKPCIAAGRGAGYGKCCDAGQLLWEEYQSAVKAEPYAHPLVSPKARVNRVKLERRYGSSREFGFQEVQI